MVRVGIIGCGHWGSNHLRNFHSNCRSKVVAFAEVNQSQRKKLSNIYPEIESLSNGDDIIKKSDIDAVIIATPAVTHYELVKKCLKNGKDVFCEKPLTITSKDGEELVRIASDNKRILMVGHTFLFNDGIRALHKFLHEGEIGSLLYLHLCRTNLGPVRNDVNVIYDLAAHDIYIANYLIGGYPQKIYAKGASYIQPGIEDVAFITLKYAPNILAQIHVSWLDPKKVRRISIIGDKKMITWDDLSSETIKIYNKGVEFGQRTYDTFGQYHLILKDEDVHIPKICLREPLANQTDHFLDCVENRIKPFASGLDGVAVIKIIEDIQTSLINDNTGFVRG